MIEFTRLSSFYFLPLSGWEFPRKSRSVPRMPAREKPNYRWLRKRLRRPDFSS